MRTRMLTLVGVASLVVLLIAPLTAARPLERAALETTPAASSILFIENVGQFPANVRYVVHGLNRAVWLTDDGVWLAVTEHLESTSAKREAAAWYAPYTDPVSFRVPQERGISTAVGNESTGTEIPRGFAARNDTTDGLQITIVKITFGSMLRLESQTRAETIVNFYRTADQATWFTAVPVWNSVRYAEVAPGVDLELWGEGSSLRWRFACDGECAAVTHDLKPGIEGASSVTLEDNRIVIDTTFEQIRISLPGLLRMNSQPVNGSRLQADFGYQPPNSIRQVPRPTAPEDNPVALLAGTFFGGNDLDDITAIDLGADGSIYFTGYTGSDNFALAATLPPGTHTLSGGEGAQAFLGPIFAGKFKPDLSALTYLTFIGTQVQGFDSVILDVGHDIAVDAQGNAYVAGETASRTFPTTPGAYDRVLNDGSLNNCPTGWLGYPCPDAFAVKLNASGALVYGTYFGGSQLIIPGYGNDGGNDFGYGLDVDAQGRIILGGETNSDDLPTTSGAYDREFSFMDIGLNTDIFIAKINPGGQGATDLIYSTYVGAGFPNKFGGLDVDASGRVVVAGQVQGNAGLLPPNIDFPRTPNAYPRSSQCVAYDCADVFFFKLNPANGGHSDMLYSTFFGGTVAGFSEYEKALAVTVDSTGAAYLVGHSDAADYPTTPNALMTYWPGGATQAAFVTKLNPIGSGVNDLVYSTYLGGDGDSEASAVTLGSDGHVYVVGSTHSSNFPYTAGAFATRLAGRSDAFLTRLKLLGGGASDLVYSTYLGGSQTDLGRGVAEKDGVAYVGGHASSSNFPSTPGAYDSELDLTYCSSSPCGDGYLVKMATGYSTLGGRVADALGQPITNVTVKAGAAQTTTDVNGNYHFDQLLPGTYTVTVIGSYFWSPAQRVISVPPAATSIDFTGTRIVKASALNQQTPAPYGTLITYTLNVIAPTTSSLSVSDVIPTHTTYISGSLISTSAGLAYEPAANAISGTLNLSAGQVATITFAAQVAITPTEIFGPPITNRACVRTAATCEWSNEVINYTRLTFGFLPLVQR